ncbi:hypothetical protein ES703_14592 [subsurface metagenome]
MSKGKAKSINEQAIEFLYSKGPMSCRDLSQYIPYKYKSINTKLLELQDLGLVDVDKDRIWHLREGVTPQTLVTGELDMTTKEPGVIEPEEAAPKAPAITKSGGIPLDQRGMFVKHMVDIGVAPKDAIPTIADIFFSGDISNLKWLNKVLSQDAAGYVTHQQRRLMLGWWANTRMLEFDESEYGFSEGVKGEKGKAEAKGAKEVEKPERRLDPGMGWKVGRDKDGAWIAQPGGPMSYQEAVDAAERRALIDSYAQRPSEEEGEPAAEGEEAASARRGKGRGESMVEKMMLKMMDHFFDSTKGRGDGESETVKELRGEIARMREDKQDERFERLEGIIANVAARDPWDEYTHFQQQAQRFGYAPNVVTDQSPAVQLIKDSTEKLDKNVGRLMGIIERTALRSEEFQPETTRTSEQRETKAGDLLETAQGRSRSRQLRRDTFGL